ncbi:Na+/proline symporter [Cadophora sp. MPI-SDFR-AT-0126]|nr:Na+/proline symporter [Leotiomycetes sp. MPI-SDFR-AT-0126]
MDVNIKRDTSTGITPPLPQAGGYVVVVVIGLIFAFGEAWIASWLWSTAMLGSTLVGYAYGVSGPFWFAAGCSPMIVFFSLLGISCKLKIPEAHTLLEIVRIRYGTVAHLVFMFLCLVNNLFAVANMLLGASAAITALTGMHVIAATFLLPIGVVVYTFVGGIKATFLTDYIHTFTILIILCFFTAKAFTVPEISSIGNLYDLVTAASSRSPISGNHHGTYMTMTSPSGIFFGIIHVTTNFGLVIMDTGFFVKAFAASPRAVVPGYVIGGIAYFAIPWALGTLMSSVAWGLQDQPIWPTYPRAMSAQEVSSGLVLPYAAIAIAGKGGAIAVLLITFMAVTSTVSAQIIAVSSIISFDIYRCYVNKKATDRDVIRWSHYGVIIFGMIAAGFSTMLYYVGVDLGWTLYMLGVVTCPGIFPTVFTILWKQQSKPAAIVAPLLGMATGISVWLGSANALYGTVTISSTGQLLPCMYGCLASTFSPLPYSVIITLFKPQNFDWNDFLTEKLAFGESSTSDSVSEEVVDAAQEPTSRSDPRWLPYMRRWTIIAAIWSAATFLGHFVLWPLPMYAAKYTFSKNFYSAWLVISIIWLWGTLFVAGFYPIIDGRNQILSILGALRKGSRSSKDRDGSKTKGEVSGSSSTPDSAVASVSIPFPEK